MAYVDSDGQIEPHRHQKTFVCRFDCERAPTTEGWKEYDEKQAKEHEREHPGHILVKAS